MSSSNTKAPAKASKGSTQQKQPATSQPAPKVTTQKKPNPLTATISKNSEMNASLDALQSLRHEYEQFEVNMDEKD